MIGWRRILFLDDDHHLDFEQVADAADALRTHRIGAFQAENFPDNSVVRHAERLAGGRPGVAPSIGSAAIRIDPDTTFFPEVYNEDWLFMYDSLISGDHVLPVGEVRQLPYDPFADPARAASEEFGDLLAEGLVRFGQDGKFATEVSEADWDAALEDRANLINNLSSRLRGRNSAALLSLRAANDRLSRISARSLKAYVTAWRNDVEVWRERLGGITSTGSAVGAIRQLGLSAEAHHFGRRLP
ncbi:hypothetical protein CFP71_34000 [Amycolatopsis thailandensis]|uniref:Glycosyltransferase 2-like domain-containing protein n=2 Tax=Amycolatopsis thailandensis TaxID=589330 RepID=A0A229RN67_9PSEU|nr:hypothetical protein CFP71_34000 [Amycolatopsis thailandensis]